MAEPQKQFVLLAVWQVREMARRLLTLSPSPELMDECAKFAWPFASLDPATIVRIDAAYFEQTMIALAHAGIGF